MSRVYTPSRLAIAVKVGLVVATSICVWPVAATAAPTQQQNSVQSFDIAPGSLTEVLSPVPRAPRSPFSLDKPPT